MEPEPVKEEPEPVKEEPKPTKEEAKAEPKEETKAEPEPAKEAKAEPKEETKAEPEPAKEEPKPAEKKVEAFKSTIKTIGSEADALSTLVEEALGKPIVFEFGYKECEPCQKIAETFEVMM